MKVGNIVNSLEVVDVKRVNKMNIIQFTKAVSEYIDQGYKLDVNSARAIGLVLMVDMYKLESNVGENVGLGSVGDNSSKEPNETTVDSLQESVENLEIVENFDKVLEEVTNEKPVDESAEDSETPVKKPTQRSKKTT